MKRRAQTICDARKRQLPLLFGALLAARIASAETPSTPAQELQAVRLLETALQVRQAGAEEWKKLGVIYADLLRKHPKDAPIRAAHGDYLWSMQEPEAALGEWRAAEKLDPGNPHILNQLAGGALAMGRPKESLDYSLRASAADPRNAATHYSIANVAFMFRHELGRSEADAFALALTHFAAAHRLEPQNLDFARGYAETFYLVPQPDWATALAIWQDFYELAPNKDFALVNLARVRMKLGQATEARACLAQVRSSEFQRLKDRLSSRINAEMSGTPAPDSDQTPRNVPKTSR